MSWLFGGGGAKSKGSAAPASAGSGKAPSRSAAAAAAAAAGGGDDDEYDADADLEQYMASSEFGASMNDASFDAELAALGFAEHAPAPKARAPAGKAPPTGAAKPSNLAPSSRGSAVAQKPQASAHMNEFADVEAAEASLQLTDEDLQDPELLAALSQVQSAVDAETNDGEDEDPPSYNDASGRSSEAMDLDQLKRFALSLRAEGRNEEALEVMRLVAARGPPDLVVQKRLDVVDRASKQVPEHSGASLLVYDAPVAVELQQAKLEAVRLKKSGQVNEAVAWLKYAKAVEAGTLAPLPRPGEVGSSTQAPQAVKPSATPSGSARAAPSAPVVKAPSPAVTGARTAVGKSIASSAPSPVTAVGAATGAGPALGAAAFGPLETALIEAINTNHKRALAAKKELESDDMKNSPAGAAARKTAATSLANYKKYQQELAVLQSRKGVPGARPAPFRWNTIRTETPVENKHLAEDQMELVINNIRDMEATLSDQSARSMSVNYSIPLSRENPISGTVPAGRYVDGKGLTFNFKSVIPLKRGRSLQIQLERKKATFDIIMHRGYFSSDLTIATVSLSLGDMLTKVDCGSDSLPMTKDGKKSVGGVMSAFIRLRKPLSSPQVIVEEERELVVDAWPDIVVTPSAAPEVASPTETTTPSPIAAPATNDLSPVMRSPESSAAESATAAPAKPAAVSTDGAAGDEISEAARKAMADFADRLSDKEMHDPMSVDFLESNDVMDAEVELVSAQLRAAGVSEDDQFSLGLRLQLVQNKLQLLVMSVQNESLSLEDYLTRIRERLQRDKVLALYCKAAGDTASAVRIMKRIKIMQAEIDNASG